MSDHEQCQPINEPLDWHDFVGIGLGFLSAIAANAGVCLGMAGNEFYSAARYNRARKAERLARREAGFELERMIQP